MAEIKVVVSELNELASKIKSAANSISKSSIQQDSETTITGNKNAQDAIKEIDNIINNVKETCNTFGDKLSNYANSIKETDENIG